jgi:GNAT superfamily N-acetyltransferase
VNDKQRFPFFVEPLNKQHDRTAFSCGIEPLDKYFRTQARQDTDKKVAATFVLVDAQTSEVAGFYTLSATTVPLPELSETIAKRLPRYPLIPAILIGRMAVDKKYQGKKLGEFILLDALKRCYDQTKQIGAAAVVVDAKNESALGFYLKMGFIQFQDDPMRLFLPMTTVEKLF